MTLTARGLNRVSVAITYSWNADDEVFSVGIWTGECATAPERFVRLLQLRPIGSEHCATLQRDPNIGVAFLNRNCQRSLVSPVVEVWVDPGGGAGFGVPWTNEGPRRRSQHWLGEMARMAVLGVVPGEERPAEGDVFEAAREAGVILQGLLCFGEPELGPRGRRGIGALAGHRRGGLNQGEHLGR